MMIRQANTQFTPTMPTQINCQVELCVAGVNTNWWCDATHRVWTNLETEKPRYLSRVGVAGLNTPIESWPSFQFYLLLYNVAAVTSQTAGDVITSFLQTRVSKFSIEIRQQSSAINVHSTRQLNRVGGVVGVNWVQYTIPHAYNNSRIARLVYRHVVNH